MKKISLVLSLVIAITFAASSISAKCYGFKDADIKVCVNVSGKDCGGITGNMGSCTGPKCYDESGKQDKNIKVD